MCLPEEDPLGSKHCNGCFDFKSSVNSKFVLFTHKFIKSVQTLGGEFGCLEI